jgi:hypothetical protein
VTRNLALSLSQLQDSVESAWESARTAKDALPSLAKFYWEAAGYAERVDSLLNVTRGLAAARQNRFEVGPLVGESATMTLWTLAVDCKGALNGFGLKAFWSDVASSLSSYPGRLSPEDLAKVVSGWLGSPRFKKRLPKGVDVSCALADMWSFLQWYDTEIFLAEIGGEFSRAIRDLTRINDNDVDSSGWYIDLDGIAALVNRTKRGMEHYKRRKQDRLPNPDVEGGAGRKDEWKWSTIRPWLERNFHRNLASVNPRNLPRGGL